MSSIVFVSSGQMSVLNDINSLISSLVAMFAQLLRVGGIISFGKQ
ncbi:hypothetical protein [Fulvivirga sp. M361]|nr:hypothetical protein [Fulvivirga sp. M361]